MSYLVIARKYRPTVFDDVIGQEHITTTLKNAIQSGRLAHAYIFSGPRGTGKTTTARILAKAINCENGGPTIQPCNKCSNCTEIAAGRSLDVLEIDGASNRGIDEIRSLRDNVRYTPVRGGYKVYIIDEFHMITKDAFNALLKTLEEPPPQVIFIFATTEPNKIIPTILSRCQRFDFKRVPMPKIMQRLRSISDAEGLKIDDESLHLLAGMSEGGMRDSLTLLDQAISFGGKEIDIASLREALGVINVDIYFETMDVVAARNMASGFQLTQKIVDAGWDLQEFLHGFLEHIRNLLLAASCGKEGLSEVFEGHRGRYLTAAAAFKEADLLRMMNLVADTIQRLRWNLKQRYIFELLMLKLIQMESTVEIAALMDSLEGNDSETDGVKPSKKKVDTVAENQAPPADVKPPAKVFSPSAAPTGLSTIIDQWPFIQSRVKSEKIRLGSVLEHTFPVSITGQQLSIGFIHGDMNNFHAEIIMKEKEYMTAVVREVCGESFRIVCDASKIVNKEAVQSTIKAPDQNSIFDHYPTVQASAVESAGRGEQDTTELFKYVRTLEEKEPFKKMIEVFDCELLDVSFKTESDRNHE